MGFFVVVVVFFFLFVLLFFFGGGGGSNTQGRELCWRDFMKYKFIIVMC